MFEDETKEEHPSFGIVGFSRLSVGGGKRRLFGSPLNSHYTTIRMTVRRAERIHGLSHDRVHGKDQLIEVEMSATQFAELLTSMNMGDGVPCTLRWLPDEGAIAEPPETGVEAERVRDGFKDKINGIRKRVKDAIAKIEVDALASVPAKKKRDMQIALECILQEVESNWPYVLDSFQESADRVVKAAKGEVDAFITHAAVITGIKELRRLSSEGMVDVPQLPQNKAADAAGSV